jgi:C_GCAxxG_C_C family probable redox protein
MEGKNAMDELFDRMLEMSRKGYFCSQILLKLALEDEEKENPDLIRAMGGLCGGMGFSGGVCGALTGGACLLGYYLCKGEDDEMEDEHANEKITKLVRWFEEEVGSEYGDTMCATILDGNPSHKMTRCPKIVERTYEKVMELLAE